MSALAHGIVALAALLAAEVEVPANDGWVTDLAGMLTPAQEERLERRMESYKRGSTNEIALLTVPSLGGETLERFALEVGRAWELGGKDAQNGALLLVAQQDRGIRIEVGRGLEGTLTDSISGRIVRDVITPEFKAGRFESGLAAGVAAMQKAAGGDYADLPAPRRQRSVPRSAASALASFFFLIVFLFLGGIGGLLRGSRRGIRSRRGTRGFGGGLAGPLIVGSMLGGRGGFGGGRSSGFGGSFGGGFSGFGGGGGFSGGGASGGW